MLHQHVHFIYLFVPPEPKAEVGSYSFIHHYISSNEQNAFPYMRLSVTIPFNSITLVVVGRGSSPFWEQKMLEARPVSE